MATVQMTFSARIRDKWGIPATALAFYSITDTVTLATLLGHLEGFEADVDAVTDGVIEEMTLRILQAPSGVKSTPGTAPSEQCGNFSFDATGSPKRYTFTVPALSNSVLVGDRINLGNAGIATLITDFSGSGFDNEHGQGLGSLQGAFVSLRKRRRQLQRSSFETA